MATKETKNPLQRTRYAPAQPDDDKCPYDYQMGAETDQHPECNDCQNWDLCVTMMMGQRKKRDMIGD